LTEEKKKDLTRIEDLSEYLHSSDDDFTIPGLSDEPPALPEEAPPPFEYKNTETEDEVEPPTPPLPEAGDSVVETADFQVEETNLSFEPTIENQDSSTNDFSTESTSFETSSNFETAETDFTLENNDSPIEINSESTDFKLEDHRSINDDFSPIDQEIVEENNFQDENTTSFSDAPTEALQPLIKDEPRITTPPPQENFQELKNFAQNITYTNLAAAGNPPFSVIIKDIKYKEDVDDIIILFKEFGIIKAEDEEKTRHSLERGAYLVSRISEFAAIIICHKLRRFDLNILMGLSDEVHPSRSFSAEDRGLISKENINQNQKSYQDFKKQKIKFADILCTTLPKVDGHLILKYISPIVDSEIIEISDYFSNALNQDLLNIVKDEDKTLAVRNATLFQNIKASHSKLLSETKHDHVENKLSIHHIYSQMLDRLKIKAMSMKGNGIINIHYSLTPLVMQSKYEIPRYQISCAGDLVWLKEN
jgi:hypothetical protein